MNEYLWRNSPDVPDWFHLKGGWILFALVGQNLLHTADIDRRKSRCNVSCNTNRKEVVKLKEKKFCLFCLFASLPNRFGRNVEVWNDGVGENGNHGTAVNENNAGMYFARSTTKLTEEEVYCEIPEKFCTILMAFTLPPSAPSFSVSLSLLFRFSRRAVLHEDFLRIGLTGYWMRRLQINEMPTIHPPDSKTSRYFWCLKILWFERSTSAKSNIPSLNICINHGQRITPSVPFRPVTRGKSPTAFPHPHSSSGMQPQ